MSDGAWEARMRKSVSESVFAGHEFPGGMAAGWPAVRPHSPSSPDLELGSTVTGGGAGSGGWLLVENAKRSVSEPPVVRVSWADRVSGQAGKPLIFPDAPSESVRFEPSDGDVDSLAIALVAASADGLTEHARDMFEANLNMTAWWRRLARAAFEHVGYFPSVKAARVAESRRIAELEAELAFARGDLKHARSQVWWLMGEVMRLRDELACRPKPADVVAVETRDQALVRAVRVR